MLNMKTNINGISYDLNDGGAMCDICDKHLHNCEPHTETREETAQHEKAHSQTQQS